MILLIGISAVDFAISHSNSIGKEVAISRINDAHRQWLQNKELVNTDLEYDNMKISQQITPVEDVSDLYKVVWTAQTKTGKSIVSMKKLIRTNVQ